MSKRQDWGFTYTADEIAQACKARIAYHEERLTFWRGELEKAESELREHGIELREHQVTGGTRLAAVLDPERQHRVEECGAKVRKHEEQRDGYLAYLAGVEHMPDGDTLTLDASDIVFFGLEK